MMAQKTGAGLITKVIATVAPRWAAQRMASRLAISRLEELMLEQRDYYGAGRGRGADGWRATNASADSEIAKGGPVLRARMRDLVRNNPIAAAAVQVLVSSLVGAGIRPRAASSDPALNRWVDTLWADWSAHADFDGHTDFHGLTALAARQMVEGGEALALQRLGGKAQGRRVPLRIQLREADHLDDAKMQSVGNRRIVQGIEYDADGRRAAFWLYQDHPGDILRGVGNRMESVRVPADQVIHMFERQRLQNRGVPWGAPVIRSLREIDDWQVAELARKKTEACLVGMLLNADDETGSVAPVVTRDDGTKVEQFEPGMIAYAKGATDIKFNQPAGSGGVYEWHRVQLHIIASGFRVPYALLTGDLSQANFSSSRVGLNEYRRMIDMMQWQVLIPMFCQPIWDWFIAAANLSGAINTPRVAVEWAPPSFESVNPLQDAQADLLDVRSGFRTLPQMIAKRGYDPDANLVEQAAFLAKSDALGLVSDADPRRVSKGGQVQIADPTTPLGDGASPQN